jgi:hypothetical protein
MASNGLLKSLWLDPLAFVERVLLHVQDQLTHDDPLIGSSHQPLDDWLVATLGNQLAGLVAKEELSIGEKWWSVAHRRNDARLKEALARDAVLASALGACECWGRWTECPICEGEGAPGWIIPDEELYGRFVQPAVSSITNIDFGNSGTKDYGKESVDVEPNAR